MNLIFDFDGTLADTFHLYLQIMRAIHKEYRFKYILEEDIETYRGMTGQQVLQHLGISMMRLPLVTHRVRQEFRSRTTDQRIFPEWPYLLEKLKENYHVLYILSSNTQENIETVLRKNHVSQFDAIVSSSSIFGKGHVIKKFIQSQNLRPQKTVYIGDETRDIEAAKKAGIASISVTWGYNNRMALAAMQPHYLIDTPQEIFQALHQFEIDSIMNSQSQPLTSIHLAGNCSIERVTRSFIDDQVQQYRYFKVENSLDLEIYWAGGGDCFRMDGWAGGCLVVSGEKCYSIVTINTNYIGQIFTTPHHLSLYSCAGQCLVFNFRSLLAQQIDKKTGERFGALIDFSFLSEKH